MPRPNVTCERSSRVQTLPSSWTPPPLWSSSPRKGLRGYFFDTLIHVTSKLSPPSTPPWPITTTDTPLAGELNKYVGLPYTLICRSLTTLIFSFNWELRHSLPISHSLHVCMPHRWRPHNSYLFYTGSGLDFYSAHAMGGDPYVVSWIIKGTNPERCIVCTIKMPFHVSHQGTEVLGNMKLRCGMVAPTQVG